MNNATPDHPTSQPSLLQRIPLAFGAFFSVLSNAAVAARVDRLKRDEAPAAPAAPITPVAAAPAPAPLRVATPDAALQLLALFQRDARLIDFTEEDLASYADADIGAAARIVHEGCRKVLREHFSIAPVRTEAEGSRIILDAGFDAGAIRLTGNVVGSAPFKGSLSHRGWRVNDVRLPKLASGHDATVLAQAEVEL
ncbi:DUF2760 domain-containing protein [Massilia sp. TWR1-2-2]|uniref:DUF2760 domain-containing protein n=1 Tax=Massilia sp. TWR1-2-2 TaxID=2804584 RepID=UPI003CF0B855